VAAPAFPARDLAGVFAPRLYPPLDLSYFDSPITPAPSEIRFGYASITWNGNDRQAIDDIGEVGFRGIQLRSNILTEFGDKPQELRELLARRRLQFVALSGGGPQGVSYDEQAAIAIQVKNAEFLSKAGGLYLQMTDSARRRYRASSAEGAKRLGGLITAVGKRTIDLGIPMAYHNHMGSLGQGPREVDALMEESDPRYVKLLLDVAHYAEGGGDPAEAILKYRDRILFLHIKDVEDLASKAGSESYRFVELGRGRVDLPAVFAALREIKFRGLAIVELDRVPDASRTPKECAIISKKYLEEKIGLRVASAET